MTPKGLKNPISAGLLIKERACQNGSECYTRETFVKISNCSPLESGVEAVDTSFLSTFRQIQRPFEGLDQGFSLPSPNLRQVPWGLGEREIMMRRKLTSEIEGLRMRDRYPLAI